MTCTTSNPLSTNLTKRSNALKKFIGCLPKNCLSVFDHFVLLALKGLRIKQGVNLISIFDTPNNVSRLRYYMFSLSNQQLSVVIWGFSWGPKTETCKSFLKKLKLNFFTKCQLSRWYKYQRLTFGLLTNLRPKLKAKTRNFGVQPVAIRKRQH